MRRRQDAPRRSVVLLELDDVRSREVPREVEDVVHLGAAPPVDRLIVIADDAQVPVLLREHAQELVLRGIGVLELVDENVAEPRRVPLREVRVLPEQLDDADDQVAEVDGRGRLQRPLVALVDPVRDAPGYVVLGELHFGGQ